MTTAALKDQVSGNVLSYVDDIVVVSKKKENYITDLAETQVKPGEVCIRGYNGEGPRMSDTNEGYRSKPRQN
jgi:hypothetical protein